MSKTQAELCDERYGFTNARAIVVACQCAGCTGDLRADGPNVSGTLGFLVCSVCSCAYVIPATEAAK